MSTTATRQRPAARQEVSAPAARKRRSVPRILAGVVIVLVGAISFGVVALRADPGVDVLVVARPVQVGVPITDADLRVVKVAADASLHVFAASARTSVLGRTAAVPLVAGTLLAPEQLGVAQDPPAGQSVIAVGVKVGHSPAGLAAGAAVLVVVVPIAGSTDSPSQAPAVVRAVEPADTGGVTVVTLQLNTDAAVRIASVTGDVSLVQQNANR
jgi:hypothetical protein